jgi:Transposase DDE domain.
MVKNERWGNPYIDNRDWSTYNERLVKRGEFYLSLDFVENWFSHLDSVNHGKRGRPFEYPPAFIEWMACIHLFFQMPYRQMEGFARKLSEYLPPLKFANYTTLFRRIKNLDFSLKIDPSLLSDKVIVAVDSTGIKVTNRGEWMREKWKVHRGWIKIHIMIDVETNRILALEVTNEKTSDDEMFLPLLNQAIDHCGEGMIHKILADGAYDSKEAFNELDNRKIQSGIKTRKNASTKSGGSPYRAECVRERNKKGGYKEWAEAIGYGMRWKVEGVYSSVKRIFGETVRATSEEGMMWEAVMKFVLYNNLFNIY